MYFCKSIILAISLLTILNKAVTLQAASIKSKTIDDVEDATTSFSVAKCRQSCFIKTQTERTFRWGGLNSHESVEKCHQKPDCFMCYDYCQVLTLADEGLATAMCSDEVFCSKGCSIACKYHRIETFSKLAYEIVNNS